MIDIYMSKQTIVGFNSNDFFYVSAQENNMMPTDASCVTILSEADENKYTQDNGETIDYDFATQCTDLANEGITQGSDTIRNGMPCFRREFVKINNTQITFIKNKEIIVVQKRNTAIL